MFSTRNTNNHTSNKTLLVDHHLLSLHFKPKYKLKSLSKKPKWKPPLAKETPPEKTPPKKTSPKRKNHLSLKRGKHKPRKVALNHGPPMNMFTSRKHGVPLQKMAYAGTTNQQKPIGIQFCKGTYGWPVCPRTTAERMRVVANGAIWRERSRHSTGSTIDSRIINQAGGPRWMWWIRRKKSMK